MNVPVRYERALGASLSMPTALEEGVLITSDSAMVQYILHLDEKRQREAGQSSFVLAELDETHLLVKPFAEDIVRGKINELVDSNTFSREMEPPPEKRAMLDDGCKEGGGKKRRPAKDKI